MSKKLLSVLTATYNRGEYLERLYNSLLEQTNKNFKWVIIDDGSNDTTSEIVNNFIKEKKIEISYSKKENGGKHTALNVGIPLCDTELIIIVDSDDRLMPSAIEDVCNIHNKYKSYTDVGFYNFLKCYNDGRPVVSLEKKEFLANYIDYRIKGNRPGDMAEVFKNDVLQHYRFPVFPNEKFISEDVLWIRIAEKYDSVFVDSPIYICEYLEDGLTSSDKKMKFNSPLGSMLRGKMLMEPRCGAISKLKGAIIYNCYKMLVDEDVPASVRIDGFFNHFLLFVTKPLGKYFYYQWRKQID